MPSNACWRSRSPSCTRTCTITVSPGPKAGIFLPSRSRVSSSFIILLIVLLLPFLFVQKFFQQLFLFSRQFELCQQIRTAQPRSSQRLLESPAADLLVVAGEQHLPHPSPRRLFP